MKKLFLFLFILFLTGAINAQQLSYRFANPRIIRIFGGQYLEFDVQIKCSQPGTYLWTSTIKLNFNNTTFNNSVGNWGVTKIGLFAGNTGGFSPPPKYTVVQTITGTAPNKILNIGLLGQASKLPNGPSSTDFCEIPIDYTTIVTIDAPLSVFTGDALAGVDFLESGMNGFQQYISAPSILTSYNNPNLFDSRDFINAYTGRFYSNTYGWSQIGGATDNVQYNNWATNVSTTVWEDASITQTDNTAALANNLYIGNGSATVPVLTIPANKWLTVSGTLTNPGTAANLLVADKGSLILNTSAPASVDKYITGDWTSATTGWHLLSSPVAAQSISGNWTPSGASGDYDFYAFDETKLYEYWLNFKAGDFAAFNGGTNFVPGRGYLVSYEQSGTKTFSGNLNVANVTRSGLANTAGSACPGWQLVGNPFTSAIDWSAGTWTKTNIDAVAQVWDETAASYKTMIEKGNIIPAMNGFMVHTPGSGSLTIPADARLHNANSWYKSSGEEFILLKANDLQSTASQSSIVRFNPQATEAYDSEFDSYFMPGYAALFYSKSGDDSYALNTLPELSDNLVIPFSFVKNESTQYSIELEKSIAGAVVYLTDKKTGIDHNLSLNPVFSFTADAGDAAERFVLHFDNLNVNVNTVENNFSLWYNQGELHFSSLPVNLLSVSLIDMAGRELFHLEKPSSDHISLGYRYGTGWYLVKVTMTDKVVTKKIYINN